MDGDFVEHFIKPLVDLGFTPKGDIVAIAESLAEDATGVTEYQLRAAVKAIRQTWKYAIFPTHVECLKAIRSSPLRPMSSEPARRFVDAGPRGDSPMLSLARRYVDDYEARDAAGRAALDRCQRGRYEASLQVLKAFG